MNRNNAFVEGAPRILGVFAHPDDETFCAGGTFAKSIAGGAEVMVVITFGPDGGYGHPDHIAISTATTAACQWSAQSDQFPAQLAAGLPVHQPVRVFYSHFPSQRQLLLEHLVPWLMQAEKRFRGTQDFTYGLLLLCEEATPLRYSSDHFAISWYPTGISIIEQGEQANSLYLILSGSVDVMREADDGSLEVLARLEPGAFFGEEGLVRRAPRNAHVVAAENVTCQVFSRGAPTAFLGRGEKARLGHLATHREEEGQTAWATTCIDVGPYLPQKMAAHRSQYAIEADLLLLPMLQELMGREYFVRAYPAPEIKTELPIPRAHMINQSIGTDGVTT